MESSAQRNFSEHQPAIVGEVVYHRRLESPRLIQPRDVVVWLPPSYHSSPEKRYPVLYAHDGQNLFDPATAFAGRDWRLDEVASDLIAEHKMQEILIVGIYNTPDRGTEYTGSRVGKRYATFVAKELKPYIDSIYRTVPGPENTGVLGSSLGGLISFFMGWWFPETFGRIACMSGSFFWNQNKAIRVVAEDPFSKRKIKIYVDVGSKETLLAKGFEEMIPLLRKKGYRRGVDLEYFFAEGADHNEHDWGSRVWRPLTFLFGEKPRKIRRMF
jgi:enterochelin esterase-like enzyme